MSIDWVGSGVEDALAGARTAVDWVVDHLVAPEPLTAITLGYVLLVRRFDGLFSRRPVRRATRRVQRRRRRDDPELAGVTAATVRQTGSALRRCLRDNLRSGTTLDIAAAVQAICADGEGVNPDVPFDSPRFRALVAVCAQALEPGSAGLTARYLATGAWGESRAVLERMAGYLGRFENLGPVARPAALAGGVTFAEGVSALTGAVVVADFASTAARSAERVAVWHTGRWDGRPVEGDPASPYLAVLAEESDIPVVGSYNGRVPTLVRAEGRQRPGSDGATLVLLTGESDYRSTEPGPQGLQCKKLVPAEHDPALRAREDLPVASQHRPIGARLVDGDGLRVPLLNVKVGLVSFHGTEPHLVLMRRTAWVGNSRGVIGPTAGGVVELAVPGDDRDSDAYGAVDYLAGARRELTEELGLRDDQYSLAVHGVFLANTRPRPVLDDAVDEAARDKAMATGELTSTVLAIGTTRLGPDDFADARGWASPGTGLFESHGVLFVPMGASADTFATNLTEGGYAPDGDWVPPGATVEGARRLADWIEQPTLVAALYASALVHGTRPTLEAFRAAAGGTPWWAAPWPGDEPGGRARVCRNPGELVGSPADGGAFRTWTESLGMTAWSRYVEPLESDARYWRERTRR